MYLRGFEFASARAATGKRAQITLAEVLYRSSGPVRGASLGADDHTTYLLSVPVLEAGTGAAASEGIGAAAGRSRGASKEGGGAAPSLLPPVSTDPDPAAPDPADPDPADPEPWPGVAPWLMPGLLPWLGP